MPIQSYPITGTVYDTDATTKMSGLTVTLKNKTKGTEMAVADMVATQADGSFSIDAANLPGTTPYTNGDTVRLLIYNSDQTKKLTIDHAINTQNNGYNAGNVYILLTRTLPYIESLNVRDFDSFGDWGDETPARKSLSKELETFPTDTTKNNASYAYTYDASNNLETITMTIKGVSYRKTFTWTSNLLTSETGWVEL